MIGAFTKGFFKDATYEDNGKEIICHSMLEENVYKTEYDNTSVIVNYNYQDVSVDGRNIPARDFVVIKGEG